MISGRWCCDPVHLGVQIGSIKIGIGPYLLVCADQGRDRGGHAWKSETAQPSSVLPIRDTRRFRAEILSDPEDARIPAAPAMVGVLVAVACIGLWPSTGALLCLTVSLAAGLVLLPATSSNLPLLGLWMMPLLSLAGGASVSGSVRRRN